MVAVVVLVVTRVVVAVKIVMVLVLVLGRRGIVVVLFQLRATERPIRKFYDVTRIQWVILLIVYEPLVVISTTRVW